MRTILFVCSGNTCRSPMAAALLNARAGLTPQFHAISAGLHATPNARASFGASFVLQEWGLDLSKHRSQPVTPKLLQNAFLILALASSHANAIRKSHPSLSSKTLLLGDFYPNGPRDISDPWGGSIDDYRHARDHIDRALEGLCNVLVC